MTIVGTRTTPRTRVFISPAALNRAGDLNRTIV